MSVHAAPERKDPTFLQNVSPRRKYHKSLLLDLKEHQLFLGSTHWKDLSCAEQTLLFTNLYTQVIIHLPTQNSLYLPHLGTEARFVWGSYLNKVFCWYICCPLRNSCFSSFHWHKSDRSRGTTEFLTLKAHNAQSVSSVDESCCRRLQIAPCSHSTETVNGEKDMSKEPVICSEPVT